MINTPEENPLDYKKVQSVQAHQEKYSENTKKLLFDVNLRKKVQLTTQSQE